MLLQADLKVDELCDGKPHYLWIQLEAQSGANTAAGGPGTELHVRTRWTKDVADDADNSSHGLSSELFLHGIGISFVEASIVKLSREVRHLPACFACMYAFIAASLMHMAAPVCLDFLLGLFPRFNLLP